MIDQWIEAIINLAHKYPKWRYCLVILMAVVYVMRCASDFISKHWAELANCSQSWYRYIRQILLECEHNLYDLISGCGQRSSRFVKRIIALIFMYLRRNNGFSFQLIRKVNISVLCTILIVSLGMQRVGAAETVIHISRFEALSDNQSLLETAAGTAYEELNLPQELEAVGYLVDATVPAVEPAAEVDLTVPVLTWQSEPKYAEDISGDYLFTPVFDDTYETAETISILVRVLKSKELEDIDTDKEIDNEENDSGKKDEEVIAPKLAFNLWLTRANEFPNSDAELAMMPRAESEDFAVWYNHMLALSDEAIAMLSDYELYEAADKQQIDETLIQRLIDWQAMGVTLAAMNQVQTLESPVSWSEAVTEQPAGYKVSGNTITISSAEGLAWLVSVVNGLNGQTENDLSNKTVKLTSNIDLSGYDWTPIGTYDNRFKGVFDGLNHDIQYMNVTFNGTENGNILGGLFGSIGQGGVVKNVIIAANSKVEMRAEVSYGIDYSAGGIAGMNQGTIDHCLNYASIYVGGANPSNSAGGIIGDNGGIIRNCINYGDITASSNNNVYSNNFWAGGIAGDSSGLIENCGNIGSILVDLIKVETQCEYEAAGGIVGLGYAVQIKNCFNIGSVQMTGELYSYDSGVGALVGCNRYTVTSSYYKAGSISAFGDKDDTEYVQALSAEQMNANYLKDCLNSWVETQAVRDYNFWKVSEDNYLQLAEAWKPKADAPTDLKWNAYTPYTAVWTDSTSSKETFLQLYKNGEPIGEILNVSGKSYDFSKLFVNVYGPGEYAYKLQIQTSDNYWASDWSEMSEPIQVQPLVSLNLNDELTVNGTSFAQSMKNYDLHIIKKFAVTSGKITLNDWLWLLDNRDDLTSMTDFEVSEAVMEIADFPSTDKPDSGYFPASIENIKITKLKRIYSYITIGTKENGCQKLETVDFPDLEYLYEKAFYQCKNLKSANLPKVKGELRASAFEGCIMLQSIDLPKISTLGNSVFKQSGLVEISFENVSTINDSAFAECSSLKKVSFPTFFKIKKIGDSAFANCSSLETLSIIKDAPTAIAENAFSGCPKKRTIQFVNTSRPLTGKDLETAINNYKAVNDGDTEDNLWYGWKIYDIVLPEVNVDTENSKIYAMGNPLVIVEGSQPGLSNIFVDKNENEILDDDEAYIQIGETFSSDGYDLLNYSIYGGGNNGKLYGDTSITMLGGVVNSIYGNAPDTIVTGDINITLKGGIVNYDVYSDDGIQSDDVYETSQLLITITDDAYVKKAVYGPYLKNVKAEAILSVGGNAKIGSPTSGIVMDYNNMAQGFKQFIIKSPLSDQAEIYAWLNIPANDKMLDKPIIAIQASINDVNAVKVASADSGKHYEPYFDQHQIKVRKYLENALNLPLTQDKLDDLFGEGHAEFNEPDTININADVKLDETINIGMDITIDLNGHVIKGPNGKDGADGNEANGKPAFSLGEDNVKLTIIDSNEGGQVIGGSGGNGTSENPNGGTGGAAIDISKIEKGTLDLDDITVSGGNGGNAYVDGNGGTGGSGANTVKDSSITGSGSINGGNGGNIPPDGNGKPGNGAPAISGDGSVNGNITTNEGLKGVRITAAVDASEAGTKVEVAESDLKNAAVTNDERKDENIAKIEVVLKVEKKEEEPNKTEIEKVLEALPAEEIGIYFDISLIKTITDNKGVTETDEVTTCQEALEIRIAIPEAMKNGSDYQVIRVHDGTTEALPTRREGNELIFKSMLFSTYAIAYTPKAESGNTAPSSGSSHRATIKNNRIYDGLLPVSANQWVIVNQAGKIIKTLKPQKFTGQYDDQFKIYYVGEDGKLVSNWKYINECWYYFDSDYTIKMNGWLAHYSDWYYFRDYQMVMNEWYATNHGRWYYLDSNGKMVRSQSVDGCWLNAQGIYWGIAATQQDKLLYW